MRLLRFTFLLAAGSFLAQSAENAPSGLAPHSTNYAAKKIPVLAQEIEAYEKDVQRIRDNCIKGRRTICGRIEKVLPDGLIVDSGYTSLLRSPLDRSWLVPGTVAAKREPNLVEGNAPDDVCVGLVFVSDTVKSRLAKPKAYDYVVLHAYPAGRHTYSALANMQRTVRHFSARLQKAVQINCQAEAVQPPALDANGK